MAKRRKKKKRKSRTAGLTAKQWAALRVKVILAQGLRCAICGEPGHNGPSKKLKDGTIIRRLYLDHDHKTDRVRGALCFKCNHRLLGRGLEDATLHRLAALYLEMTRDWRNIDGYRETGREVARRLAIHRRIN